MENLKDEIIKDLVKTMLLKGVEKESKRDYYD